MTSQIHEIILNGYAIHIKVDAMIDPKSMSWLNYIHAFGEEMEKNDGEQKTSILCSDFERLNCCRIEHRYIQLEVYLHLAKSMNEEDKRGGHVHRTWVPTG